METSLTPEILDKIDQYIKGILSESERIAFENQLAENAEWQEELSLQQALIDVIGNETWSTTTGKENEEELQEIKTMLQSEELQSLSGKIKNIGAQYVNGKEEKKKPKLHFRYYAIAAAIALLFGIFFFMNYKKPLDKYYTEYVAWDKLPSYVEKGSNETDFSKGSTAFKAGNYTQSLSFFKTITPQNELYPVSLIYKGAAYELMNKHDKALQSFNQLTLIDSFVENSKGHWYKLLVYLKTNNKKKTLETLNIIVESEDNYHYKEALELKKELTGK